MEIGTLEELKLSQENNLLEPHLIFFIIQSPSKLFNYFAQKRRVKNILKGSLDLIPSPPPSVKIQIIGGKICLQCNAQQCFAITPQANFPTYNFNFH